MSHILESCILIYIITDDSLYINVMGRIKGSY